MAKDYSLEKRKYVIGGFITAIVIIFLIRLFNLQVSDGTYKENAESNAFFRKVLYPSRGLIYDRNGRLIVLNQPEYDVMLIPKDLGNEFDTVGLCEVLNITKEELMSKWADMKNPRKNPGYSAYTPQKLMSHLSQEDYGRLQEKLYLFPGFYVQKRNVREYATHAGANILGNIREVNAKDVENDHYYRSGDYTGDLGVEKSYEPILRGVKGVEILMKDALGRIKGKYEDGIHDVIPVAGRDITLSIDMDLQEYGEKLMRGKIGAIVAIEPKTGEILCMVSSPSYDPSLLVGSDRGKNYASLVSDKYKPLYDRALQGAYPPGSTFKPTQGLIFMQEGTITPSTAYPCYHGYVNGIRVGCHSHGSPLPLKPAIATSCNAYFCWGLKNFIDKKGSTPAAQLEKWKNYMVEMGYGYRLGVDLPSESRGFIPNPDFYSKSFRGKNWSANSIISISIGQGEVLATPLQIANLASTIANRGWFITPHVVKEISDTVIDSSFRQKRTPSIKKEYYEQIAEGMRMAVTGGTCRRANLPGLEVCGKTGTAQNPHGRDHSVFMGFAPLSDPKIAVAVYVENAGFGATYGVPIGSLIIEKYLNGTIAPERKYLEDNMCNSNTILTSGVKKH
ncbi:MAG: penicillin-binding protein 2 [Muribaculaceae bacterium]|nr:penicillin-binding protein 2 [Muribaculaceae bacterium]MDE6553333.1 penicillin-binding protein 2 [Muribaculaceae bacterium]